MEYEKIKKLIDDVSSSKLTQINIEFPDGTKIKMEKENDKEVVVINSKTEETTDVIEKSHNEVNENKNILTEESSNIVKSPMVGTFYMKPSPTSNPYVEVGSIVKKGDILCIIEAMKLMNEIESEVDGKIVEVLVHDGEAVDYGKPLFRIV